MSDGHNADPQVRFQYVIANLGIFGSKERMVLALAYLGQIGFELVTVFDKASNWFVGLEKGFMLFKRAVPPGESADGPWCGMFNIDTMSVDTVAPTTRPVSKPFG
jgi:hypothetical protein